MEDLTEEEIMWINSPASTLPVCEEYGARKKRKGNVHIGEITIEGQSLIKGPSKGINAGDEIEFIISKSVSHKDIARFKHLKTGREIGKLSGADASFISSMVESELACFSGSIIFISPYLKLLESIFLTIKVELVPGAFVDEDTVDFKSDDEVPNSLLAMRKKLLGTLFERTGLIDEKQAAMCKVNMATLDILDDVDSSDLSKIFGKSLGNKTSPVEPPIGMSLDLRDYQKVALAFMISKENLDSSDSSSLSALWIELKPRDRPFYLNPCSGELRFTFPREKHTNGGILADEMGLGKTIEILALIHSNRLAHPISQSRTIPMTHSTLIVCPLNLISQWQSEAHRCFKNGLVSCDIFYGNEKKSYNFKSKSTPTIVITTYGTLKSEFLKQDSALFAVHWHRIVLDEAHFIKERSTMTAKSAYALQGSYRWCVTGTPIVNKLDDLYSLIKFLQVDPWSSYQFWHNFVTQPFSKRDVKAIEVVQTILEPLILRRTKDMRDSSGNLIIPLPPKEIITEYLTFTAKETELYQKLSRYSIKKVDELRAKGKADYIHVFSLLSRLRQMCNHPHLVWGKSDESLELELAEIMKNHLGDSPFASKVASDLQDVNRECPVCFETTTKSSLLPCHHIICKVCLEDMFEAGQRKDMDHIECPVCRKSVFEKDIIKVLLNNGQENEVPQSNSPKNLAQVVYEGSSKIKALMSEIETISLSNPTDKVIVFSQWTSMLDIIQSALASKKLKFVRLDGSMQHNKRDSVLQSFKTDETVKIMLASLRSTGTGLNLTVANRVFLVDPWWNVAVENQAIDRVHRLGQEKPVYVKRLIIKDTIEEKMLAIQTRKSNLINSLSDGNSKVDVETMIQLLY